MRSTETGVAGAVSSVVDFLTRHDAVLGTLNASGARTSLDAIDAEMDGHAASQSAGTVNSQRATVAQHTLRVALRTRHMLPIARVARTQLQTIPDYSKLKLPNIRINSEKLVADARAMGEVAQEHEAVFVSMGLAPDFVAQLNAAATELHAKLVNRSAQTGRRAGATKGLGSVSTRARAAIGVIDALVTPLIDNDPALLGEWKSAKKIRRVKAKTSAVVPPPVVPPAPVPTVAAA
jgi:hypothetical protein